MSIIKAPGLWRLSGDITFSEVPRLLAAAGDFAELPQPLMLDLAEVQGVDTASLSLLLEFRRRALAHNKSLRYVNLPTNLLGLARLYGMESLLTT